MANEEQAKGAPCSLIPLLFARHGDIERAMNEAVETFQNSVNSFDFTAKDMYSAIRHDSISLSAMNGFVQYCKLMCTGLLYWSCVLLPAI
jgi:hypothetical protein